ncbi:MAG: hypothetical protein AAGG07_05145 [Planctomycetota bacterium]
MTRMICCLCVCAVAGTAAAQTPAHEAVSLDPIVHGTTALPFDISNGFGVASEDATGPRQDVVLRTDFIPAPGAAVPLLGAALLGSRRRR